jgi:hypothetical protein
MPFAGAAAVDLHAQVQLRLFGGLGLDVLLHGRLVAARGILGVRSFQLRHDYSVVSRHKKSKSG